MNWDRLKLITPPSGDVVTLADAKAHLRVDTDDENAMIQTYIDAARAMVEGPNGIGVALLTQTWEMNCDRWPESQKFVLPLHPIQSITSITYTDAAGNIQTLDTSLYKANVDASPAEVWRAWNAVWPLARHEARSIVVRFVTGYGATADDVPMPIKAAILLIVGHLYANRSAVEVGTLPQEFPLGATALLDPYRVGLFS